MRNRCMSPINENYPHYGGRGITICKRWAVYDNFAVDMGPHPGKGWSLDRKNNNGNYNKRNCRWATQQTQQRNRRITKLDVKKVKAIREMCATGKYRQQYVATRFGITQSQVSHIVSNSQWVL